MKRKLKIIRYIVIILWIIFYAPIKARWGTDGWLILSLIPVTLVILENRCQY